MSRTSPTRPRLLVVRPGEAPARDAGRRPQPGDTAELPVAELHALLSTAPAPRAGAQRKLAGGRAPRLRRRLRDLFLRRRLTIGAPRRSVRGWQGA